MYFDTQKVSYTERMDTDKGHVYDFTGPCHSCKKPITVTVVGVELFKFNTVARSPMIQDALVSNTKEEREFLISGTCSSCFDKLFREGGLRAVHTQK